MEHKLTAENYVNNYIIVIEQQREVTIKIENNSNFECITLTKEQLHSFIGTLLHVQQKMK